MKRKLINLSILFICLIINYNATSQVLTKEDSLNAGLLAKNVTTVIGGYGEAAYRNDLTDKNATINLTRNIVFLGHKFNNKISLFSETEIEDAKIEGGEAGGEIALEQLFLKFNINRNNYIAAGLFIPRIGITNENHLPTTFNTVARPRLETKLIPSTWRELGVSLYGVIPKINGLNYSFGLMNGLNSRSFKTESGIRSGRFEGSDASAQNIAVTGSLLYYVNNFRIQLSGYYGGTNCISKAESDSFGVKSGAFALPVSMEEFNIQYRKSGFYSTLLLASVQMPDAPNIDTAYAPYLPELMLGFYAEVGYNILEKTKFKSKKLNLFIRHENFDLDCRIADNSILTSNYYQTYTFAGVSFLPLPGVIIKADFEYQTYRNSTDTTIGTDSHKGFINFGIGYSF